MVVEVVVPVVVGAGGGEERGRGVAWWDWADVCLHGHILEQLDMHRHRVLIQMIPAAVLGKRDTY